MILKKTILTTFIICFSFATNAQVKIKPGIRSGVNFSKLLDNDTDITTGFYFGGFAAIQLKSFFTLQPEITFSRQGGKVVKDKAYSESNVENNTVTQNLNLSYAKFSLMSKFYPFPKKNINLSIGPSLGVLIDDNLNSEIDDTILNGDMNLVLGLGYEFSFGLGIETRYNRGFIDIFGNNFLFFSDTVNRAVNRGVELGLYYKF